MSLLFSILYIENGICNLRVFRVRDENFTMTVLWLSSHHLCSHPGRAACL
jgi:hypothetical protein